MNTNLVKVVSLGLLFLSLFIFGFWLSRLGKPYNQILFTIHKLIGLAAGIFLIIIVIQRNKLVPLHSLEITAIVSTALILVLTIAAGGLLSIQATGGLGNLSQGLHMAISRIHRFFPYLATFSTAATIYLIFFRR